MKFEVIIGNPPYQNKNKSIYQNFIDLAVQLSNRHVVIISKDNWLVGDTLQDVRNHIVENGLVYIHDFPIRKEVFKDANVAVAILHVDKNKNDDTHEFIYDCTQNGETRQSLIKPILTKDGYDIISNEDEYSIVSKVTSHKDFESWNLTRNIRIWSVASNGNYMLTDKTVDIIKYKDNKENDSDIKVIFMDSKHDGYCKYTNALPKGRDGIDEYKVVCGSKVGKTEQVITSLLLVRPGEIVTNSYSIIAIVHTEYEAKAVYKYVQTKLFRELVHMGISGDRVSFSYSCSKYVPMQDFTENSDIDWNKSIEEIDDMLSKKYGLTEDEERYIANKIVSI